MAEIKKLSTELQVKDKLLDTSGDAGTSGQVLSSTGTGTNWINAITSSGGTFTGNINIDEQSLYFYNASNNYWRVQNNSAGKLVFKQATTQRGIWSSGELELTNNLIVNGGTLQLGADVTLFRDGANILRTDDAFHANGHIHVGGASGGGNIYNRSDTGNYIGFSSNAITFSKNATFAGSITATTETLTGSTSTLLTLNPTANNYGGILFQYGGSNKGFSVYNSGSMVYGGESGVGTILQVDGQHALNIDTSKNATFAGDLAIKGATLHSYHQFNSDPVSTSDGNNLFSIGGHGMGSGYSRNISIWSTTQGVYRSWIGTNLRFDGTNYKRAVNAQNNNWGNIAGMMFWGNSATSGKAIEFIIDPPENASGGGTDSTIGTSLPSGYTALTLNNDLSATFAGTVSVTAADSITIADYILHSGDDSKFGFPSNDTFKIRTGGVDRFTLTNTNATFAGIVSVPTGKAFRMYNAAGSGWGEITLNETDNKIQFNRGIQPSGNDQSDQDLGTSSHKWNEIHATQFESGSTAVKLKNAGNTKLLTTGGGVDITGELAVGNINSTGTLSITSTYPRINLTDTNHNDDWSIINADGNFRVYNITDDVNSFNIDASNNATFAGDVTVSGNLNITGDINSVSVTDLDVTDKTITVGVGQTAANSGSSGILISRSDAADPSMLWNQSTSRFDFNSGLTVTGQIHTTGSVYAKGSLFVIDTNGTNNHIQARSNGTEGFLTVSNGSNWGLIMRGPTNDPRIGAYHGGTLKIEGFHSSDGATGSNAVDFAQFQFGNDHFQMNAATSTFAGDVTVTGGDITIGTDSIAGNINSVGDVLALNVDSNTGGGAGANIQLKTAGTAQLTVTSSSATFAGNVRAGNIGLGSDATSFGTGVPTLFFKGTSSANGRAGALYFKENDGTECGALYVTDGNDGYGTVLTAYQGSLKLATGSLTGTVLTLDQSNNATFVGSVTVGHDLKMPTNGEIDWNAGAVKLIGTADDIKLQGGSLSITGDGSNAVTLTESGNGDFTIDVPDDLRLDAGGGDVVLRKAGTEYARLTHNNPGLHITTSETNASIYLTPNGTGNVYASTDTFIVSAYEGETAKILLRTDESDDNGDDWYITNETNNNLEFTNDKTGSQLANLTLTPQGPSNSAVATFAGNVVAGNRIQTAVGSAGAPTHTFTGKTDTGMYARDHSSNDRLAFSVDGTERAYIDSNGVTSMGNYYLPSGNSFRNYSGVWAATTGTSGNGFTFTNTADNSGAVLLSITSDSSAASASVATFAGKVNVANNLEVQNSTLQVRDTSSNLQLKLQASVGGVSRIMAHNTNIGTNHDLDIVSTQIDFLTGSISGSDNSRALFLDSSRNATFAGGVTIEKSTPTLTFNNLAGGGLDPILEASGTNFNIKTSSVTPLSINLSTQAATFAGNINFGDSHFIGDDADDNLLIQSSSGENLIIDGNGRVILRDGGSTKLETSSTGITVTSGNQLTINNNASNNDNGIHIKNDTNAYSGAVTFWTEYSGTDTNVARVLGGTNGSNGILYLQVANTSKALTTALSLDYNLNASFAGSVHLNSDSAQLQLGDDNDMQIYHNGANGEINNATGTFTIDSAGQINIDSGNAEIHFKGSGTTFGKLFTSGGNFYINHPTSDKDIIFSGSDGGSTVTALTLDMSSAGTATFNNELYIPNYIYHVSDANTYFGFNGSDDFRIYAGNTLKMIADGTRVRLYYNGSEKFSTTSTGISVTGDIADRDIPCIINTGWGDDSSSTSSILVPLGNTVDDVSIGAKDGEHTFVAPYAGKLVKIIMKNTNGTLSSSFTTELKYYKNGSSTATSGELTASSSAITWAPTSNNTFAAGDEINILYQKSAGSKYWREVSMTIVIELTDYDI